MKRRIELTCTVCGKVRSLVFRYGQGDYKPNCKRCGRLEHGMHKTPTWNAWCEMIRRCTNPNIKAYANYGGRGITVCERWRRSFLHFVEDVGEKPDPNLSLDHIDNNGNYEPGNVRWATPKVQANNRRPRRVCGWVARRAKQQQEGRR